MEESWGSEIEQTLPAAMGAATDTPPFAGTASVTLSGPDGVQCAVMLNDDGIGAGPPVAFTTVLTTLRWPPAGWSQVKVFVAMSVEVVPAAMVTGAE